MTARISKKCGTDTSRSIRTNLLAWTLLCPTARYIVASGLQPLEHERGPPYHRVVPLMKEEHEKVKNTALQLLHETLENLGFNITAVIREHWTCMEFKTPMKNITIPGRADTVILAHKHRIGRVLVYMEASSTEDVKPVKRLQTTLRALALYYTYRIPVWMTIVSLQELHYSPLTDTVEHPFNNTSIRLSRLPQLFKPVDLEKTRPPGPGICSLCDLRSVCPHHVSP